MPTFSSTPDIKATDSYAGHYSKINILRNRQYVFNCSTLTQQIIDDAYAGECTNVSVLDNVNYVFSSSIATDFITLTNGDSYVIYASGVHL